MLTHVLALSGFLLLRRDRPHWPRPIRLAAGWTAVAAIACLANVAFIVFGLIGLAMTGYAFDAAMTSPTAWMGRIVLVGFGAVVAAAGGYVVAQRQQGRPARLRDPAASSLRRRCSAGHEACRNASWPGLFQQKSWPAGCGGSGI